MVAADVASCVRVLDVAAAVVVVVLVFADGGFDDALPRACLGAWTGCLGNGSVDVGVVIFAVIDDSITCGSVPSRPGSTVGRGVRPFLNSGMRQCGSPYLRHGDALLPR